VLKTKLNKLSLNITYSTQLPPYCWLIFVQLLEWINPWFWQRLRSQLKEIFCRSKVIDASNFPRLHFIFCLFLCSVLLVFLISFFVLLSVSLQCCQYDVFNWEWHPIIRVGYSLRLDHRLLVLSFLNEGARKY
jgi:hypothetical protein